MRISSIMNKQNLLCLLLMLPFSLQASGGGSHASLGEAADNLMTPVSFMTKLALLACYIIGIALLLAAIAQYKIHRQSPKLVPLTTPITLLVIGLTALGIPYATYMFGDTFSAEEQNPTGQSSSNLPLPDLNANKGPKLPNSGKKSAEPLPPPPPAAEPVAPPPSDSGGGRWTEDPKYN